jgi:hypothetical protein
VTIILITIFCILALQGTHYIARGGIPDADQEEKSDEKGEEEVIFAN